MKVVIDIPEEDYERFKTYQDREHVDGMISVNVIANGIPLNNLLQRLRKRISDLYNTDVIYDNGDYNTMNSPTLDKVLEYFDSEVQE